MEYLEYVYACTREIIRNSFPSRTLDDMNTTQYKNMMNRVISARRVHVHPHTLEFFENYSMDKIWILLGPEIYELVGPESEIRKYLMFNCAEREDYIPCDDKGAEKLAVKEKVLWDIYRSKLRETFGTDELEEHSSRTDDHHGDLYRASIDQQHPKRRKRVDHGRELSLMHLVAEHH